MACRHSVSNYLKTRHCFLTYVETRNGSEVLNEDVTPCKMQITRAILSTLWELSSPKNDLGSCYHIAKFLLSFYCRGTLHSDNAA